MKRYSFLLVLLVAAMSATHASAQQFSFKGIELGNSRTEVLALHKLKCTSKGMTLYDEVCRFPLGTTFAEVSAKSIEVNLIGGFVNSVDAEFDRNQYAGLQLALAEKYRGALCQEGKFPRCSWHGDDDGFFLLQKWKDRSTLSLSETARDREVIEERSKAIALRKKKDM